MAFAFYIALLLNKKELKKKEHKIITNKSKLSIKENITIYGKKRVIKDVLFINGCNATIFPQPYRYRVLYQMEQLYANFLESDVYFYLDLKFQIIKNYRIIIFFRCPLTREIEKAIFLAKALNKKILFDIDDFMIDIIDIDKNFYFNNISQNEKKIYNKGIKHMEKIVKFCDGVITTTESLAKELINYTTNIFINHNVAGEELLKLSEKALINYKQKKKKHVLINIGYFGNSLNHYSNSNIDLYMIKPALQKILREFKNVKLLLFGEYQIPKFLKEFTSRIVIKSSPNWDKLPEIISNIDINIKPIENNIFNFGTTEINWVEASLVKVPSITSNYGEFNRSVQNNKTGLLCSDTNDWYISLKTLIKNENLRKILGENAYKYCKKKYNTLYTGMKFANYINSVASKHIGFFIPSLRICGGTYVILKHASFLKEVGYDVDLIVPEVNIELFEFQGYKFSYI